jgi:large subunit ribosomal protein L24
MSLSRIKKDDMVVAVAGADAGKTGKVLQVLPERGRAVVEGLKMMKKTLRKSEDHPQGGIAEKEGTVALSNLMLYCPNCKKGVRVARSREGKQSVRKCRSCEHAFEA